MRTMEKKRWVLVTVAIVTVVSVAGALLYVLSQGMISGPRCHISVDLRDPLGIDSQAWAIEVSDVTYGIPECRNDEVDQFSVVLEKGETEVIPITELRNGLVGKSNNTFVFFEDNDKIGRLDRGDIFYIVGVESSSEYEFSLILALSSNIVGHVSIST